MSRRSIIPAALAALLAITPAFAQQGSSGNTATSGSDSSSTSTSDDAESKPKREASESESETADAAEAQPGTTADTEADAEATTKPGSEESAAEQAKDTSAAQARGDASFDSAAQQPGASESDDARASQRGQQDRTQRDRGTRGQSERPSRSAETGADLDSSVDTRARTAQERPEGRADAQADAEANAELGSNLDLNRAQQNRADNQQDTDNPQNQDAARGQREIRNRPSFDDEQDQQQPAFDREDEQQQSARDRLRSRNEQQQGDDQDRDSRFDRQQDADADDRWDDFPQRSERRGDRQEDRADRQETRQQDRQNDRQDRRETRDDRFGRDDNDRSDRFDDRDQRGQRGRFDRRDRDFDVRERLGIRFDMDRQNNLVISSLQSGSLLAEAGIRQGDVLLSVDGQPVSSMAQFNRLMTNVEDSQRIPLVVRRDGRQQRIYLSGNQLVRVYGDAYGYGARSGFWQRVGLNLAQDAGRLVINSIAPRGYFADYGFQQGDVIISAYGRPVRSMDAFQSIILDADPGTRIPVAVYRDGSREMIYITAQPELIQRFEGYARMDDRSEGRRAWLGVTLDPRYDNGALVRSVERGSPADEAGVREGDLIRAVNGREVRSPDHLSQMIDRMDPQDTIDLQVTRRANVRLQANLDAEPRSYVRSRTQYEGDGDAQDYERDRRDYDDQYNGRPFDSESRFDSRENGRYQDDDRYESRTRANLRATDGFEDRTDDRGAFEFGDGDGRIFNRDEGGLRGRIFGGNR